MCFSQFYSQHVTLGYAGEAEHEYVKLTPKKQYASQALSEQEVVDNAVLSTFRVDVERYFGRAHSLFHILQFYRLENKL